MYTKIETYCKSLEQDFKLLQSERAQSLREIAEHLFSQRKKNATATLIYICTHNSRRSHFGQVWAQIAAAYYGITAIESYSGGTEATAFHPNAVSALERVGFVSERLSEETNPHYLVHFSSDALPCLCYSKIYSDAANPQSDFTAVMMCSDADENCPVIFGAAFRRSTPYADPKAFDGTLQESQAYDERCREIARDTLYLFFHLKKLLHGKEEEKLV
jgi:arsenate reductase (thioredoxin)